MTKLQTLREFSALQMGTAIKELPLAKTEWLNTGELRWEEKKEATMFRNAVFELQQKWVQLHKGEVLKVEWRPVHTEYIPNYW